MTSEETPSDAELIEFGINPLPDERITSHEDLRTLLDQLGHDQIDPFPTTQWNTVFWSCDLPDCDGQLLPLDTRMLQLPSDPTELDDSVPNADKNSLQRYQTAHSATTVPVVICDTCNMAFKTRFNRLHTPEDLTIPEPRIIETPEILGGRPRLDGTRIGVEHIIASVENGSNATQIAKDTYPRLTQEHVQTAIDWAEDNPERMAEIQQETTTLKQQHDIFQSAVDAGVEEVINSLWKFLADAKTTSDPVRPIGSLLRNGFEQADGLEIDIDTENNQVIFNVDVSVLDIDSLETATANNDNWTDSTPTDAGNSLFDDDN